MAGFLIGVVFRARPPRYGVSGHIIRTETGNAMIAEATIAALGFSRAAMSWEAQALPVAPVAPSAASARGERSQPPGARSGIS
jgi:hypothetical protein